MSVPRRLRRRRGCIFDSGTGHNRTSRDFGCITGGHGHLWMAFRRCVLSYLEGLGASPPTGATQQSIARKSCKHMIPKTARTRAVDLDAGIEPVGSKEELTIASNRAPWLIWCSRRYAPQTVVAQPLPCRGAWHMVLPCATLCHHGAAVGLSSGCLRRASCDCSTCICGLYQQQLNSF